MPTVLMYCTFLYTVWDCGTRCIQESTVHQNCRHILARSRRTGSRTVRSTVPHCIQESTSQFFRHILAQVKAYMITYSAFQSPTLHSRKYIKIVFFRRIQCFKVPIFLQGQGIQDQIQCIPQSHDVSKKVHK